MPLKLSDLTKRTKTIQVDLGDGDVIQVEFRLDFYTPEFEATMASVDEKPVAKQAEALAKILVGWDVTDDDGKTLPPSQENLAQLGVLVTSTIMKKISEEALPLAQKESPSGDT